MALDISAMVQGLQVNKADKKKCSGLSPNAWNAKHFSFRNALAASGF